MTSQTRRSFIASLAVAATLSVAPASAQSTLQERVDAGKVTIGIHNRAPWGFKTETGEVAGFHPDLVREALAPLGITEIDFVVTEFGALIPGLQARRFDMIASGIAITPERCKQVIFSEPDLSVVDAVIVKKGNPMKIRSFDDIIANPDFILAGGRGTLNTQHALKAGVPEDRMMQVPSGQESLSAVLADRAHGSVMSAPTAMMLLKDPKLSDLERAAPFTGLLRADGTPEAMATAIAFRPDDTELRDAYNERLAEMKKEGAVKEIMQRYGFSEDDAAPERSTENLCAGS